VNCRLLIVSTVENHATGIRVRKLPIRIEDVLEGA
jgi:CO/xanthine dehydrogenase Mo-binding subunit